MSWVKRILQLNRAGHSGTLDPQVTGVLPVMLENGTKIANFLLTAGKEYICIMRLHKPFPEEKIRAVSSEFVGDIYQRPPLRSSVKRRVRTRTIYYLDILEIDKQNVLFKVGCQAGTYIRKLCLAPSSVIMLQNGGMQEISTFVDMLLENTRSSLENGVLKETLSLDLQAHKLISAPITGVQRLPAPKEMIRITLESGISLTVTPDHELLVDKTDEPVWIEAENIKAGQYLFAPRKLSMKHHEDAYILDLLDSAVLCTGKELQEKCKIHLRKTFGSVTRGCKILGIDRRAIFKAGAGIRKKYLHTICEHTDLEWELLREFIENFKGERGSKFTIASKTLNGNLLYLLGLIASDGCISQDKRCMRPNRVIFANKEKDLIDAYIARYNAFFPGSDVRNVESKSKVNRITVDNHILASIAVSLGIVSPKENMQLNKIVSLSEELIAQFLAGYFDGDGCVYIKSKSHHTNIVLDTKHYHVAKGILLLLKRLGLRSKVFKSKPLNFDRSGRTRKYSTRISTPSDKKHFAQIIPCQHPHKKQMLTQFKDRFTRYGAFGASDLLPLRSILLLKTLMKKFSLSKNSVYRGGALSNILAGRQPTRLFLSKCIESLSNLIPENDPLLKELKQLASAPYYLIRVKTVERIEPDFNYVYDITVNPHHNFIINGSVVISNCHDIGEALGSGAHMAELRRTRTGPFREDKTLAGLHDLVDAYHFWKEDGTEELIRQYIQPLETGVTHLPQLVIRDTAVDAICHGANLAVAGVLQLHSDISKGDKVAIMTLKGELVGVATAQNTAEQILDAKSGIVATIERVVMRPSTYPASWQRKS